MIYERIPIVYLGSLIPHSLYTLNNQGPFFHCSIGAWYCKAVMPWIDHNNPDHKMGDAAYLEDWFRDFKGL